jgi:outer membrane murein-binding lipoprotein Lpp
MTQSTISDDRLDRIEQKLDHLSTTVDNLSTTVDTLSTTVDTLSTRVDTLSTRVDRLSTTVDTLSADNEKFNDRFSNYQQATQWVVQLAFTLIASATITVIITSVLRR